MTDLIQRPRRLRKSPALRAMFEETTLSLNDLVLPIFVEEELDDYKAIDAMPGVMRIPEKHLAREIERIANAGIRSVMTFGISHHTDDTGSDAWKEDGLVARMSRICKQTVPEMIVMSDTCFCEYTSHGHCGVLCDHGVDNDLTLTNLGKQAVVAAQAGADRVRAVAAGVLEAAGVEPEYLEVRGRDLGEPPAEGDARLLVAATIGGVRLIDNVGLPLGIGFTNIEEHEAKAELEREKQREQDQSPED